MTCIIGYIGKNRMYIGGDSAGVSENSVDIRTDEKVFKKKNMLFGFTSSFRLGQLLRFSLNIPKQPDNMNDYAYMCTFFIDAVRECFKEGGYSKIENNKERGGIFLVCYKGEIYRIDSDFQVGTYKEPFVSIGSGEDYARGALNILKSLDLPIKKKIEQALVVAASHSTGVRPPFHIISKEFETIR